MEIPEVSDTALPIRLSPFLQALINAASVASPKIFPFSTEQLLHSEAIRRISCAVSPYKAPSVADFCDRHAVLCQRSCSYPSKSRWRCPMFLLPEAGGYGMMRGHPPDANG